jgi:hypothetical protein
LNTAFAAERADLRTANLFFEQNNLLTRAEVEGQKVTVDLDTGGKSSVMWPLFGKEFVSLLQGARKDSTHWIGADGAVTLDAAILPELRIKLAGFPVVLPNVPTVNAPTTPASYWHYGQLGMDAMTQATEVTFDFKAMKLQLK